MIHVINAILGGLLHGTSAETLILIAGMTIGFNWLIDGSFIYVKSHIFTRLMMGIIGLCGWAVLVLFFEWTLGQIASIIIFAILLYVPLGIWSRRRIDRNVFDESIDTE